MHEGEREVEPALHAARVAADAPVRRLDEADTLEQLAAAADALGLGHAVHPGLQPHVLATREEWVERGLLEGGADGGAHARALAHHVEAGDAGRARGRRKQRREHEDGGRLAGAVGPEEAVDLAGRDVEVDAVHGPRALLEFANEALGLDAGGMLWSHRRQCSQKL